MMDFTEALAFSICGLLALCAIIWVILFAFSIASIMFS